MSNNSYDKTKQQVAGFKAAGFEATKSNMTHSNDDTNDAQKAAQKTGQKEEGEEKKYAAFEEVSLEKEGTRPQSDTNTENDVRSGVENGIKNETKVEVEPIHESSENSGTHREEDISPEEKLIEENKRLTDELLRTRAEMENSRKRLQKLFEDKVQEKSKALLLDIVELLDNFERALNVGDSDGENQTSDNATAVVEGIKMIEAQFLKTLETNWKLSRYDSTNAEFNPTLHEAMMKEDSDKVKKETVVEEFMKGYMYNQKVLRPAKVKVAMPK